MKKVGIVGCGKEKKEGFHEARELYTGYYTRLRIKYAEQKLDDYYILSAKHGLIPPHRTIENYDKKIKNVEDPCTNLGIEETVNESASNYWDENTEIVLLLGQSYMKPIEPALPNYVFVRKPFEDTSGIGEQIKWLRERVETPQKTLNTV